MKNRRLWSLGLTIVMAVSVCGCSESTEAVKVQAEEMPEETVDAAGIAREAVSRSAGGNVGKEETVYVNENLPMDYHQQTLLPILHGHKNNPVSLIPKSR